MRLLVLTLTLLLLAACGQKGNLYLPGQPPPGRQLGHAKTHASSQPAPAATSAAAAATTAAPAETTAAPAETTAPTDGSAAPVQP